MAAVRVSLNQRTGKENPTMNNRDYLVAVRLNVNRM